MSRRGTEAREAAPGRAGKHSIPVVRPGEGDA
ncbi:hypothetical protein Sros_8992 [Streptosporangium roseum DSM 43021]|uniref:Uncharacterized protein n=1 Tax=Streptosporangium roseum (strain ATCC 12428 / DSM 43021 / JCM 3005 / KCTC 9067 / NCIMB 10171 / NRRL 2505 / NI 9100) TaxID=479432 RepID=D2B978_STRRD|nr:hypothetical protein Sros_8992 [Streptosporangium roseum DSM 43021]